MPGTNQANRIRQNHQLSRRLRTSGGRKRINKARYEERSGMIVNAHQKRMLKSNPQANISLSKKKIRQLTKAINHERKRLEEKGVVFMDEVEEEVVEEVEEEINKKQQVQKEMMNEQSSSMELTGSGQGTTLGVPL